MGKKTQDLADMLAGTHHKQTRPFFGYRNTEQVKEQAVTRKVGDTWIETLPTGRQIEWEQRDGFRIKRSANLKNLRSSVQDILTKMYNCPKETCTCTYPSNLDLKFQRISGMCSDCHITEDTRRMYLGEYKDYELGRMKANAEAWLKEAEQDVLELKAAINSEFVTENGEVEKWQVQDPEQYIKEIDESFEKVKEDVLGMFNKTKE